MAYATVDDIARHLGLSDTRDETAIVVALDAAEESVHTYCGRSFDLASSASARVFRATGPELVCVDDIATTVGMIVTDDGTTVTAGVEFDCVPLNGRKHGQPWPVEQLVRRTGCWSWSSMRDQPPVISVTAVWGWPAVPPSVRSATILLAADLFHGRDARFGVIGLDAGVIGRVRQNPQAAALLDPFVLHIPAIA